MYLPMRIAQWAKKKSKTLNVIRLYKDQILHRGKFFKNNHTPK